MRIGVTGHMNLTPATVDLVFETIRGILSSHPAGELTGVSCIAAGADSIFAEAVLDVGGRLEVVLPAANYREVKVNPDHAPQFDTLIANAASVRTMSYPQPNREAYEAANEALLSSCDQLIAVWDGRPSNGKGGTGDVVEQARSLGIPIVIVWPDGAQRSS